MAADSHGPAVAVVYLERAKHAYPNGYLVTLLPLSVPVSPNAIDLVSPRTRAHFPSPNISVTLQARRTRSWKVTMATTQTRDPGLKRSLSVWQAVGLSLALMAPSMAANINPQGAIGAGRAVPLAFLIAAFGVLLVAYTFVRLCQYYRHSGSVYAFVGATLGPRAGVIAGWGLVVPHRRGRVAARRRGGGRRRAADGAAAGRGADRAGRHHRGARGAGGRRGGGRVFGAAGGGCGVTRQAYAGAAPHAGGTCGPGWPAGSSQAADRHAAGAPHFGGTVV